MRDFYVVHSLSSSYSRPWLNMNPACPQLNKQVCVCVPAAVVSVLSMRGHCGLGSSKHSELWPEKQKLSKGQVYSSMTDDNRTNICARTHPYRHKYMHRPL